MSTEDAALSSRMSLWPLVEETRRAFHHDRRLHASPSGSALHQRRTNAASSQDGDLPALSGRPRANWRTGRLSSNRMACLPIVHFVEYVIPSNVRGTRASQEQ